MIQHPNGPYLSLPMTLDDVKPTIGEAHQVGFAIARAIISWHPREKLNDFTESERDEIERFRCLLELKQLAMKLRGL